MVAACMDLEITGIADERVSQTSVTVSWKTPDCDGLVDTFHVTAAYRNGTSVFRREVDSQKTSLLIQPLHPGIDYTVTVVGIDCYGVITATRTIGGKIEGIASPSSFPSTTVSTAVQTTNKLSGKLVQCYALSCLVNCVYVILVEELAIMKSIT